MERKIAKSFNEKVQTLIRESADRDSLYGMLGKYQHDLDLKKLVSELRLVINEPRLIELYEGIRPLIPVKHQIEYDRLTPRKPGNRLRLVRLNRRHNEGLGFSVRGGLEHGVGIYVSDVDQNSHAYERGLRLGDEIVRINGFTIGEAIHQEVLNLIKANQELTLKVRNVGMIPVKNHPSDKLTWKYVDIVHSTRKTVKRAFNEDQDDSKDEEVKLRINVPLTEGLGCSICTGPLGRQGIYIQSIKLGSLAQEAGLDVGDQILEVNGVNFTNITHSEAVVALKGSRQLDIVIKKAAGEDLFRPSNQSLSEEEEKALRFQQLTMSRARELKAKTDQKPKQKPSDGNRKWQKEAENQEALIHQAIKVIEDKEATLTKTPLRQQPLEVHTTIEQSDLRHSKLSPVYMSEERMPSFRIQKPVLLHPTSKVRSSQADPIEEESFMYGGFTEENFMPSRLFTNEEIAGRQVKLVSIQKTGTADLGIVIESTGIGKIFVAEIYEGGAVHKQGGIHPQDQILMVDGRRLLEVNLEKAYSILKDAFQNPQSAMQFVVAKAPPSELGEEVTYF